MERKSLAALSLLSAYLNDRADAISAAEISELARGCGITNAEAFSALLTSELGLDPEGAPIEREICAEFFRDIGVELDAVEWKNDLYYRNIAVPDAVLGACALSHSVLKAGEAFVYGDLRPDRRGLIKPKLGFFMEDFAYPQLTRDGRAWMTITPNEIYTSLPAISAARGDVVTFGLGMGYFAYIVSQKPEVSRVTCVDNDPAVIALINKYILPQFPARERVEIIEADAFEYLKTRGARHDFAFCDIWHDALDGPELYLRFKALEKCAPNTEFSYWIEDTIKCYL